MTDGHADSHSYADTDSYPYANTHPDTDGHSRSHQPQAASRRPIRADRAEHFGRFR